MLDSTRAAVDKREMEEHWVKLLIATSTSMWLSQGYNVVVCWTGRRESLQCLAVKGPGEYLADAVLKFSGSFSYWFPPRRYVGKGRLLGRDLKEKGLQHSSHSQHGLVLLQALMQKASVPNQCAETGGDRDTSAAWKTDLEGCEQLDMWACIVSISEQAPITVRITHGVNTSYGKARQLREKPITKRPFCSLETLAGEGYF